MIEYPSHDLKQLGFTELVGADLLSQHAGENHGIQIIFIFYIYIMLIL